MKKLLINFSPFSNLDFLASHKDTGQLGSTDTLHRQHHHHHHHHHRHRHPTRGEGHRAQTTRTSA
jgi:hypothetical protein